MCGAIQKKTSFSSRIQNSRYRSHSTCVEHHRTLIATLTNHSTPPLLLSHLLNHSSSKTPSLAGAQRSFCPLVSPSRARRAGSPARTSSTRRASRGSCTCKVGRPVRTTSRRHKGKMRGRESDASKRANSVAAEAYQVRREPTHPPIRRRVHMIPVLDIHPRLRLAQL